MSAPKPESISIRRFPETEVKLRLHLLFLKLFLHILLLFLPDLLLHFQIAYIFSLQNTRLYLTFLLYPVWRALQSFFRCGTVKVPVTQLSVR